MIWKRDCNHSNGGRWRCRVSIKDWQNETNGRRVSMFGFTYLAPDMASKEFALHLREERKNASQTS